MTQFFSRHSFVLSLLILSLPISGMQQHAARMALRASKALSARYFSDNNFDYSSRDETHALQKDRPSLAMHFEPVAITVMTIYSAHLLYQFIVGAGMKKTEKKLDVPMSNYGSYAYIEGGAAGAVAWHMPDSQRPSSDAASAAGGLAAVAIGGIVESINPKPRDVSLARYPQVPEGGVLLSQDARGYRYQAPGIFQEVFEVRYGKRPLMDDGTPFEQPDYRIRYSDETDDEYNRYQNWSSPSALLKETKNSAKPIKDDTAKSDATEIESHSEVSNKSDTKEKPVEIIIHLDAHQNAADEVISAKVDCEGSVEVAQEDKKQTTESHASRVTAQEALVQNAASAASSIKEKLYGKEISLNVQQEIAEEIPKTVEPVVHKTYTIDAPKSVAEAAGDGIEAINDAWSFFNFLSSVRDWVNQGAEPEEQRALKSNHERTQEFKIILDYVTKQCPDALRYARYNKAHELYPILASEITTYLQLKKDAQERSKSVGNECWYKHAKCGTQLWKRSVKNALARDPEMLTWFDPSLDFFERRAFLKEIEAERRAEALKNYESAIRDAHDRIAKSDTCIKIALERGSEEWRTFMKAHLKADPEMKTWSPGALLTYNEKQNFLKEIAEESAVVKPVIEGVAKGCGSAQPIIPEKPVGCGNKKPEESCTHITLPPEPIDTTCVYPAPEPQKIGTTAHYPVVDQKTVKNCVLLKELTVEEAQKKWESSQLMNDFQKRFKELEGTVDCTRPGSYLDDPDNSAKYLLVEENMWNKIRNSSDDIEKIARNTGFSKEAIKQIKEHVFYRIHIKRYEIAPFNPDYDMAKAWERLCNGDFLRADIELLRHELAESILMGEKEMAYDPAHKIVERFFSWDELL